MQCRKCINSATRSAEGIISRLRGLDLGEVGYGGHGQLSFVGHRRYREGRVVPASSATAAIESPESP
jgi:hypothetical protein